jgi:hypothetical protein
MREGLEDFDLSGAYKRLKGAINKPTPRAGLQQSEQPSRASTSQRQVKGKIPFLCNGGRESCRDGLCDKAA